MPSCTSTSNRSTPPARASSSSSSSNVVPSPYPVIAGLDQQQHDPSGVPPAARVRDAAGRPRSACASWLAATASSRPVRISSTSPRGPAGYLGAGNRWREPDGSACLRDLAARGSPGPRRRRCPTRHLPPGPTRSMVASAGGPVSDRHALPSRPDHGDPCCRSRVTGRGNHSPISRAADSGESEPCTRLLLGLQTEVAADAAGGGLLHRVGAAGELAERGDRARSLDHDGDQRPAGDEFEQGRVEALALVFGVVLLGDGRARPPAARAPPATGPCARCGRSPRRRVHARRRRA